VQGKSFISTWKPFGLETNWNTPMSKKTIERNLKKALLDGGPLAQALFEYELEEHVDEYMKSKQEDHDEYFFAVTEHSGDVAMLLIDENNKLYINEEARAMLKKQWRGAVYKSNIQRLLPDMASELDKGYLYTAGVKYTDEV
jgi:hypothetical protein